MKIFQIVGVAVLGASLSLVIRPIRPELSMITGIVTGITVALLSVAELSGVVDAIGEIARQNGVDSGYVGTLLKILGVAYAAQFGVQVCRDAGETAVAGKVELCGRVLILACALPAVAAALSTALGLLRSLP